MRGEDGAGEGDVFEEGADVGGGEGEFAGGCECENIVQGRRGGEREKEGRKGSLDRTSRDTLFAVQEIFIQFLIQLLSMPHGKRPFEGFPG